MKPIALKWLLCGGAVICSVFYVKAQSELPYLQKQDHHTKLMVYSKPFLMLAGELGNSSASDLKYMQPVWDKLVKMNLNTILIPVYWELMEPAEGNFDFTLVDSIISQARQHDLKVVLLWFGSWKNSMSCYVPLWVKKDQKRFPRARKSDGSALEILSPFYPENRDADSKAFAELLKHIKQTDSSDHTVIMIQVENETGMIPQARDYCEAANKAFSDPVPAKLIKYMQENKNTLTTELFDLWNRQGMKTSGKWTDIFGENEYTDEVFMAWHFARYTQAVASEGKKHWPLPMYANAALIREGYKPGQYPSAGPLPHLIDIWRTAAPDIDFLAPDIYFRNFTEWTAKYDVTGNPLFIPEAGNNQSMAQAFYAFAKHDAMGYSPFSIESLENPGNNQVHKAYSLLQQLLPVITENQGRGTMDGFLLDSINDKVQIRLGKYLFNIRHEYSWAYATRAEGEVPRVGGMIIMMGEDDYIIAGSGIIITVETVSKDGSIAGIASLDEGEIKHGEWVQGRRMNGDQSHQGRHMHLPGSEYGMQRVKLYTYK